MEHKQPGPSADVAGPAPDAPVGPPPVPDTVTGALSVPLFGRQYAKAVMSGRYEYLAIWYIDIRNFRSINPAFGFLKGNLVLRILVEDMRALLTHELPLMRLGADRFVLLTAGLSYEMANSCFERLLQKATDDMAAAGVPHQLKLCAGIYYLRSDDLTNPSFQKPLDYVSIAHRNARKSPGSQLMRECRFCESA